VRSPYPKIVSHSACTLLEKWYRYTREATVRAVFPEVGYAWRRKGLAWECTVAPILSRPEGGRKPPRHPDWQEAGHAFLKVCPSEHEAMVLDAMFGPDTAPSEDRWPKTKVEAMLRVVAKRHGYTYGLALETLHRILNDYQTECEERGLVYPLRTRERYRLMGYLTRIEEIARHFGVSPSTIRRWMRADKNMPIRRTPSGGYIAKPEELDKWARNLKLNMEEDDKKWTSVQS
jgi:transcriptional regulator with XRE-family HTH domain